VTHVAGLAEFMRRAVRSAARWSSPAPAPATRMTAPSAWCSRT